LVRDFVCERCRRQPRPLRKGIWLARRLFHDDNGKAYGELETGTTRLTFASIVLATEDLKQPLAAAAPDQAPLEVAIALTTSEVQNF